jgi:hypothetical protein
MVPRDAAQRIASRPRNVLVAASAGCLAKDDQGVENHGADLEVDDMSKVSRLPGEN